MEYANASKIQCIQKQNCQIPMLVHDCVLQACDSDADPTQAAPPFAGAGLLQTRLLDCVPLAQLLVHVLHADQSPQLPLTI